MTQKELLETLEISKGMKNSGKAYYEIASIIDQSIMNLINDDQMNRTVKNQRISKKDYKLFTSNKIDYNKMFVDKNSTILL